MVRSKCCPLGSPKKNAFSEKSLFARLAIILAGVVVNFLFGVVAFAGIYSTIGIPTPRGEVVVTDVKADSPAAAAGLQSDDVITSFTNEAGEPVSLTTSDAFIAYVESHGEEEITFTIQRGEEQQTLQAIPQLVTVDGQEAIRIGIGLSDSELLFYPWWQMPLRGAVVGLQDSVNLAVFIVQALRDMVVQSFQEGTLPKELSGPVGIVDQTYQSGMLQQGWLARLNWMALISVNLAIMNLLPIPALDGGRAVFLLLEPILGKARRLRWETWANNYGMMLLLGLIVLITLKDIWQIVVR
ncbi:M50 family metallopeptidase [Candidatus Woesebacteria bacterium]|nr:M50 family metallopeptidase [Candidatus Woesebacteria bacterium]